jgi:hypothetical protein
MLQTLLMRASLPPLASVSCYGQCPSWESATACCRRLSARDMASSTSPAKLSRWRRLRAREIGEVDDDDLMMLLMLLAA